MDNQTLTILLGVIVTAIVAVGIYEAGRKSGEAGILAQLKTVDASKPTLDALEGLVTSVPGDVAERIIAKVIDGYAAARPLVPTPDLQAIGDSLADILKKISDGQPNDPATPGTGVDGSTPPLGTKVPLPPDGSDPIPPSSAATQGE